MINEINSKLGYTALFCLMSGSIICNGLYYGYFGVNIFNFIDPSEIILLFGNHIIIVLRSLLLTFLFQIPLRFLTELSLPFVGFNGHEKRVDPVEEKARLFNLYMFRTICIGCFVTIFLFLYGILSIDTILRLSVLIMILYIGIVSALAFPATHSYLTEKAMKNLEFIFLFFCIMVNGSNSKFNDVFYFHSTIKTKICFSDSVHISDSSNYYIGQSSNFVFIHNSKKKETAIYPLNAVKQIVLPTKTISLN
jgi:hypothetical protein